MKTRFFYTPQSFKTWPNLYVLTEDGFLYFEYLDHMTLAIIRKQVDLMLKKQAIILTKDIKKWRKLMRLLQKIRRLKCNQIGLLDIWMN